MRIWIVLLVWLMIGCNDIQDCDIPTSRDFAIVAFYEADSTEKFRKDTLIFNRDAEKPDTLLPSGGFTLGGIEIDPSDTAITYGFDADSIIWELSLSYSKKVEIFYDECDPIFVYTLDSAYSPNFDSVVIINENLDRQIPVNIEIYF